MKCCCGHFPGLIRPFRNKRVSGKIEMFLSKEWKDRWIVSKPCHWCWRSQKPSTAARCVGNAGPRPFDLSQRQIDEVGLACGAASATTKADSQKVMSALPQSTCAAHKLRLLWAKSGHQQVYSISLRRIRSSKVRA